MTTIYDSPPSDPAQGALPGRQASLFWSLVLAPAYLCIALSIMGGIPAIDAVGKWAFVASLTLLSPGAHALEVFAWRIRRGLGSPAWWTLSRHRNADKAIWMAAIVAFCLIPQSLIGWPATIHWAICWLGLIPLVFMIGEAFDSAFGRFEDVDDSAEQV